MKTQSQNKSKFKQHEELGDEQHIKKWNRREKRRGVTTVLLRSISSGLTSSSPSESVLEDSVGDLGGASSSARLAVGAHLERLDASAVGSGAGSVSAFSLLR